MLNSLKKYHLAILVSCDAWELNFIPDLAVAIGRIGGIMIKEMYTIPKGKDTEGSVYSSGYLRHPYAFIGIPGIGDEIAGNSIES